MADLPASLDYLPASPDHAHVLPDHLHGLPRLESAFPNNVVGFLDDDLAVEIEEDLKEDQGMNIDEDDPGEDQAPEAPHLVGRPFSIVASRDALHHHDLAALHVRLEGVESTQTELRRFERAIFRDVRWLREHDEIIQQIAELIDRVDDYPREQVDTLRVEVDGLHRSAATMSQRVQTLKSSLQKAREEIQDLQMRVSASKSRDGGANSYARAEDSKTAGIVERTMPPRRMNQNAIERLIADRVAKVIAKHKGNRANAAVAGAGGAGLVRARGVRPAGAGGASPAGGNIAPAVCGCSYKTVLNCNPHTFSGTEGAVGLSRWFEELESIFRISKCSDEDMIKFSTCTLQGRALTWNELQRMKQELWDLTVIRGWMSISKRPRKNTPQCYTKPLDSLKNWNNRFFWVDERVFPTVVDRRTNASKDGMPAEGTYSLEAVRALDTHHMDLFNLIRAPNPTKVKIGSRPRAPHEVPLLTLTANRVIEMDDPAAATDSSGVPSTIERSPLDFSLEVGASDQGTAAPEMPPSGDVPSVVAPGTGQAEEVAAEDPLAAAESRKRGHDGIDVNAPPSHCEWIMLILGPQGSPMGERVSLLYNWAWHLPLPCLKMHLQASVTQIYCLSLTLWPALQLMLPSIAAAGDPESENASSPAEVGSPGSVYRPEWGVTNGSLFDTPKACQDLYNVNLARQVAMGSQLRLRFEQEAKLLKKSASGEKKLRVAFEEFKRYEDDRVERRCVELDARLDALSIDFNEELYLHMLTAIAGRRWVIGHGLRLAVMKYGKSLDRRQAFANVVSAGITNDQLEGLKDAPVDVIMAALYLESYTGEDAPQYIRDLRPSSSQLTIPVYPEGLALLLVDAATQTEFDDT
nr:hypothetical protein [Tanacetum cinerariifolium]